MGFWTMASLRCAPKFVLFLFLDCAPRPSTLAQSKERKGSNFAIWQPCVDAACRLISSLDPVTAAYSQSQVNAAPPLPLLLRRRIPAELSCSSIQTVLPPSLSRQRFSFTQPPGEGLLRLQLLVVCYGDTFSNRVCNLLMFF